MGRSRRRPRTLAAVALAVCVSACGASPGAGAEPSPIVVITVDTLRADRLGCYGYFRDTSPNIDRFSRDALLFEQAVTTMATTLPAHVSLWTSLHPLQTGVETNYVHVGPAQPGGVRFFSQMLADLGFANAAFVSASPLKKWTGVDLGFRWFEQPVGHECKAEETTERALEWLDASPRRPFFLWLHYFDPHAPRDPPPRLRERFGDEPELTAFLRERKVPDLSEHVLSINNRYDAEVLYADEQVGRVLDKLRELDLYDESTIVLVADHGEGLGQHDHGGHGRIYNEQLFIPLLIKFPKDLGIEPGRRPGLVSILDVVPTLVATLELPLDEGDTARFAGRDVLAGPPRELVLSKRSPETKGEGEKLTLITAEWKYHHRSDGAHELYDLRTDPHETANVAAREPAVVADLQRRLLELVQGYTEGGRLLETSEIEAPESYEELRKLGYVR